MSSSESGQPVDSCSSTGLIQRHGSGPSEAPAATALSDFAACPVRKTPLRTEESFSGFCRTPSLERASRAQPHTQCEDSSSWQAARSHATANPGSGRVPVSAAEESCGGEAPGGIRSDPSAPGPVALATLVQGYQAAASSASLRDYFLADFAPKVYGRRAVRTCMSSCTVVTKKPESGNVPPPVSRPHGSKERGRDSPGPRRKASGSAGTQCTSGWRNPADAAITPRHQGKPTARELPASSSSIQHASTMPLSRFAPLSTCNLRAAFLPSKSPVSSSTVPPVSTTAGGKGSFRRSRSLLHRPCKEREQPEAALPGRGSSSCSTGPPVRRYRTGIAGEGKTKCERPRSLRFEETSAKAADSDTRSLMTKNDTPLPRTRSLSPAVQPSGQDPRDYVKLVGEGFSPRIPGREHVETDAAGERVSKADSRQKSVEGDTGTDSKNRATSDKIRFQGIGRSASNSSSGISQPDSSSGPSADQTRAAPPPTETKNRSGSAAVGQSRRTSWETTQGEKQVAPGAPPLEKKGGARRSDESGEKVSAVASIPRPVCVPKLDLTPVSEARNALNPPLKKTNSGPSADPPCISGSSTDRTSCRSYTQKTEPEPEEALGVSSAGKPSRADAGAGTKERGGLFYMQQANASEDIGIRGPVNESQKKELSGPMETHLRPDCPNRSGMLISSAGLPPVPGGRAGGSILPRIPISSRVVRCNPSLFTARVCALLAKQLEEEEQQRADGSQQRVDRSQPRVDAAQRASRSRTAAKKDNGPEATRAFSGGKAADPPGKDPLTSSASSSKSSTISRTSSNAAPVLARPPPQFTEGDEEGPQRNRSTPSTFRTNSSSQTRSQGSDAGSNGPRHQTNVSTSGSLNQFVVNRGFLDVEPLASTRFPLAAKSAPLDGSASSPRNPLILSEQENRPAASSPHDDARATNKIPWTLDLPERGPRGYCPFEHGNHTRPGSSECSPAATAADLQGQQPALVPSPDCLPLKSACTKIKSKERRHRARERAVEAGLREELAEVSWDVWSAAGPGALAPDGTLLTADSNSLLDSRESLQAALFLKPASTTSLSLVDNPPSPQPLRSEAALRSKLGESDLKTVRPADGEHASDGDTVSMPVGVGNKARGDSISRRQKRETSTKYPRKELGRSKGKSLGAEPGQSEAEAGAMPTPTEGDGVGAEQEVTDDIAQLTASRRRRRNGKNVAESEVSARARTQATTGQVSRWWEAGAVSRRQQLVKP